MVLDQNYNVNNLKILTLKNCTMLIRIILMFTFVVGGNFHILELKESSLGFQSINI